MFSHRMVRLLFPLLLVIAPAAQGSGFALGTDVIRFVDQNQDPDGLFNLFVQTPAGHSGAVAFGYASGDRLDVIDVGYKHYLGRRFSGVWFQAGAGYYDADHDDSIGFVGKVGYERQLARHFAVTGAVRMVAGVDSDVIGYSETPVYQPMLGAMFTF